MSGRTLVQGLTRDSSGMLFYIMMLETKGILPRRLFFLLESSGSLTPSSPTSAKIAAKDSLRSLIGVFAVIPLVDGMAGTAFSASADADRRNSKVDRDILHRYFLRFHILQSHCMPQRLLLPHLTISQSFGWLPAGRFPICFTSTVIRPL